MSSLQLSFRPATAHDSHAVAALHIASWRSTYRGILSDAYLDHEIDAERTQLWEKRFTPPISKGQYVVLAEQGPLLLGFACVQLDVEPEWGPCLDNLHVHPEHKSQGIGRQLFAQATAWVISQTPEEPLHLWVLEGNQDARRFYDHYQGVPVERMLKRMPDGTSVAALRYLWRDLEKLQASLTRR